MAPTAPPIAAWTERSDVTPGPSAREDHTWTLDGTAQVAYLFGGRTKEGPSNELWAFDLAGETWTLIQSPAQPAPRFGHTATWVTGYGLIIWSGQGNSGFFDDIWAFDGVSGWHELPSLGAVPPARYGSCAAFGPDTQLWISHGFTEDAGRFADTRSYDFATGTWTDRTPADQVPVERCLHDCFWSSEDQLVLYGGQTTGVLALDDIWAYDFASATWTRGPDQEVPARQLYAMANHGQTALVFGGGSLDGGFLADTFELDATTMEFRPYASEGSVPPGRSGAALILDEIGSRYLLFGGKDAGGVLGDLWELAAP